VTGIQSLFQLESVLNIADIKANAYSMPFASPSYPKGPYHFVNREFLIISYRTDAKKLREIVPEPLTIDDPIVSYEFIRMPDSSGFGDYTESGQVISVIDEQGRRGGYTHMMYLDDEAPIAGGRELWGFPKKLAKPKLVVDSDTLLGTLDYGQVRVATGTMGYKYQELDRAVEQKKLSESPNYLLKIIPHVDGSARVCELVRYYLQGVNVKGAWTGPARLELFQHALAPIADLPVLEIVGAKHLLCDLTLGLGEVAYDYLKP
jgi:acetoacetate decarboxylase